MHETNESAQRFAEIVTELHSTTGISHTADAVAEFAVTATGCHAAGILLVRPGGQVETVAATNSIVQKADDLQIELEQGPCMAALRADEAFEVRDTLTDEQWPEWSRDVALLGLRSVLGIALEVGDSTLGALNLYQTRPEGFDSSDVEVASILARHAAIAIADARRVTELREAVDTRTVIGLAQGILMERYSLDADRAFELLEGYSQASDTELHDLADNIVKHRRLPPVKS
ncbi:MAG: GAF and ANTAR domain-containing protein [Kribbellaceae bacterium]|nr:GAF and ANTAR domain-containing protein [Kribbellaceae bacterium]